MGEPFQREERDFLTIKECNRILANGAVNYKCSNSQRVAIRFLCVTECPEEIVYFFVLSSRKSHSFLILFACAVLVGINIS